MIIQVGTLIYLCYVRKLDVSCINDVVHILDLTDARRSIANYKS